MPNCFHILSLILYHFVQFGSHASRNPSECRLVMLVTLNLSRCAKNFFQNFFIFKKPKNFQRLCMVAIFFLVTLIFCQAHHASHGRLNWMKWYSIQGGVGIKKRHLELIFFFSAERLTYLLRNQVVYIRRAELRRQFPGFISLQIFLFMNENRGKRKIYCSISTNCSGHASQGVVNWTNL